MAEDKRITRRDFLKQSAIAAAAAGAYAMTPPSALGANDRINIGVIGYGSRGGPLLRDLVQRSENPETNIKVVAVCEVYDRRREAAQQASGGRAFLDYTEMLAHPSVDAVVIATPDHWHARMSIDAMNAGKDVYCEKPMTLYWQEAKEVARVQAATGRVMQVGAQSCSEDRVWKARDAISQGKLGKVLWTSGSYSRNSRDGEWNWGIDPDAGPQNIDWKRWLGPAPQRPFDPERFFRFRKYWDYSGGIATDLFYHTLAHLEIALGPEFPKRVSGAGGIFAFHDREVPDTFHMLIDYPTDHTVVLTSSMANRQSVDDVIRGHEATLYFDEPDFIAVARAKGELTPEQMRYFQGSGVLAVPEDEYKNERPELWVPAEPRADHMTNWLECLRSRKQPHLDAQTGYRIMVAIALGVMSYRKGQMVHFDPVREELIA